MEKVKSSFYLPAQLDKKMRIEAAKLGLSYPSEFIVRMWEEYKKKEEERE